VYSLGIVLYEMLTGAVPFTGDSAVSVAMRHMNDEVPAPSALQPDVPAHLDDVVRRATQKEPERRFADASEMSAVLLGGESALETSPLPTPGMVAGAASSTLVAGSGTEVLQTSRDREEGLSAPAKRTVVLILGALAAIVLLLALYRGFASEDRTPAERRAEKKEEVSTDEEAEPAAAFEIPEDLYGESAAGFVAEAEAAGVIVDPVLVPTEDLDPGLILKVVPSEGTAVPEGETITLSVSSLPVEDEDKEDKEDEHGPPEGKGKPDKEDKDKD
jgi:hypothetical protein